MNRKIYIGSSVNLYRRWNEHKRDLNANQHCNQHLQNAWGKYGELNFVFEVLELVDCEILLIREQYWIDTLTPYNKKIGFNIAVIANAPTKGKKLSIETRSRISDALKGKKKSFEHIKKSAEGHRGKKLSRAHIDKIVSKNTGKKRSTEFSEKLSKRFSKQYIVISPEGIESQIINLSDFCRKNNLSVQGMNKVATGERLQYKGWKCKNV